MDTKEPDSRLSVRKQDLDDKELYRLNAIINDLYSKVSTARDETANVAKQFKRSGVIASPNDQSKTPPPPPPSTGIPQPAAGDWSLNPVIYSAGEDGLQYGFASATISNKSAAVDYYSMFIQDYSSGYVNTLGTTVTLTSDSKEAGNTFERCVKDQVININGVAYILAADAVAPFESVTLTTSAGTQSNVYFNLNPIDGGYWEEIASDAEAGTWQLRPPQGWDVPCCLTASTKTEKVYQPADGVNYKRLVFAPWGDAPQVTNFSVTVEKQDPLTTDIPSGKFVVNFTKPLDPEYNYVSIERLWLVYSGGVYTGNLGATAIVNVVDNTVTYNSTSLLYGDSFKGQYFNYIQPGDTVYINSGASLPEATSAYIVSEVISNTQLKLTTNPPPGTEQLFAQWGRLAGEVNPFTQTDYWPLPTNEEYWRFRARSVNHREIANNASPPTVTVTVPASGGITPLTPPTQLGSSAWALNPLQYSTDQAGNSAIFISATITTPSTDADYYSLFWQKTSGPPVAGAWEEIAADAIAGTWREWPSAGATYIIAIAANKNTYKLDQPDTSIPSYYKSLVIPPWGDADQVTGFSVTVETDNRAGVPSGRFVFNFTKPADPDYYYAQISRIATDASYNPLPGATYGIVAGEIDPTKQTDWWPLPATAEYWKFKSESVNYRKVVNTASAPTSNVSVTTSSGITQIAPATITTAAFASTIRPVDLVTTAGISVTSIVVSSNTGTVTTSSAHGLASGRQVAIYGGTGTSAKLNGLYTITVTGGSTFTITTSGVSNGTYSAGLSEVPLPSLPSSTYPAGATAFVTANTKLYRSSGTAWTSAADGSDIVSNSITAGQIAAGAISTTELFAGEILVGQGGGKPSMFKVVDSGGNMIGFIGDITTPVAFTGGYFQNLLVSPTLSTTNSPRLYATSSGTLELVGMKIQATGSGSPGGAYTAGTVVIDPANSYAPLMATDATTLGASTTYTAVGSNYVSTRNAATGNSYPYCELYRTSTAAIIRAFADPTLNSYVEFWTDATPANSYANFKGVPIKINNTTAIDTSRNGSFVNLTATGTLTAGGSTGTSGQVLTSTGTGIQWSTAASSGITSVNSMTGPAITISGGTGITVSSATNTVTISIPQSVATTSDVTFNSVNTATVGPTTATALNLRTDNTNRWAVSSTGMFIPAATDTYDIGILSSNRVRGVYAKIVDTAIGGGTGDYIQTRKLQLFDNTGSITSASFWDFNVVVNGIGVGASSYFYMRDNSGTKVFQSERVVGGSAVSRTFWYTDLYPDTNLGRSLGSPSYKWQTVQANQLGDSSNTVVVYGGNSTFSQISTGAFQFTASPSLGYFLKSDGTGYGSWATVTSQLSAGTGISITGTATATITNSGVTSLAGTSNQVTVSASTGSVTLSLPQSIGTTSSVIFGSATLANGSGSGILIKDSGGTARTVFTLASDNNLYIDNLSWYDIYLRPGSGRYVFTGGSYFLPSSNNSITCGNSTYAWSNVYSYGYYANNGASWVAGATGSFTTADSKTVTVQDGIIISIV